MPISKQCIVITEDVQVITARIDGFLMTVPFVPGFRLVSPKRDSNVVIEFPESSNDGKIIIRNAQECCSSIHAGIFNITVTSSTYPPLWSEPRRITSQFDPTALRYLIDFDKPLRPIWNGMKP